MRLAEKLLIGVVLCVLALLLMPRRGHRKVDNYYASLRSDMRFAIVAQNTYYGAYWRYTTVLDSLSASHGTRLPSAGVQLSITRADSSGWELVGRHHSLPTVCTWRDGAPPQPAPDFSRMRRYCTNPP